MSQLAQGGEQMPNGQSEVRPIHQEVKSDSAHYMRMTILK